MFGVTWRRAAIAAVASIDAGAVAPSEILTKLAAYRHQNLLDLALQEIGRIERTLFTLDWLEDPDLRRRCRAADRAAPPLDGNPGARSVADPCRATGLGAHQPDRRLPVGAGRPHPVRLLAAPPPGRLARRRRLIVLSLCPA